MSPPVEIEAEPLLEHTDAEDETHIDPAPTQNPGFQPMSMASEAEQDDEDESAWLAELQRRPWRLRPSVLWLVPLMFIFGTLIGVIGSPLQQLSIQIVCKDYLFQQHGPQDAIEYAGFVLSDDRCKTAEVLSVAALVDSHVFAFRGTISKRHSLPGTRQNTSNMLTWLFIVRISLGSACHPPQMGLPK